MSLYVNDVWIETLKQLIEHGRDVKPRGMCTKEFSKTTVVHMAMPVLTVKKRKLGYKFMAAEAHWILTGNNRVKDIAPYSKAISKYSDNGYTFFGAYGPKFVDQIDHVLNTLSDDKDSRQAVINIWREKPPKTKDVPCTLNLQWTIRDGYLECHANMRSSDIWLGWPYDVFNFSMMSRYILHHLAHGEYKDLQLGVLYLHSGCMHLYETDRKKAEACIKNPGKLEKEGKAIAVESNSPEDLIDSLVILKEDGVQWPE